MATKKVYDACCREMRRRGCQDFRSGRYSPDLVGLFGEKLIANQREFERCSETEQRRHLYEDYVLRFLYLKDESYRGFPVKK